MMMIEASSVCGFMASHNVLQTLFVVGLGQIKYSLRIIFVVVPHYNYGVVNIIMLVAKIFV